MAKINKTYTMYKLNRSNGYDLRFRDMGKLDYMLKCAGVKQLNVDKSSLDYRVLNKLYTKGSTHKIVHLSKDLVIFTTR